MQLSFVIPAYNEESYIDDCLDSIEREMLGKEISYEIIVVNNASTDHTGTVVKRHPNIMLVREPQKGLSRARQRGFEVSQGALIANVDADTRLPPGWIDTVLAAFTKNKKLVALSGPHVFYDVTKADSFLIHLFYYATFFTYLWHRNILRVSSVIQGGNFVVRRAALEQIGGYNTDFEFYGEDADLAKRLFKVGRVDFTFKLPIYASGRRLLKEGKIKVALRYFMNYVWTICFGKPLNTTSVAIRSAPKK